MNTHGDKAKMVDAVQVFGIEGEPTGDQYDYNYDLFTDAVMREVENYDIVFIPVGKEYLDAFDKRNIDYDLFYPSKERRGEFIENMVRKRLKPQGIMMLDRDFNKMVDEIDSIDKPNCYKHKMNEAGHFIGNDNSIMQYINNIKQTQSNNEQKSSERVEESSRSEENNEENEA